MSPRFKHPFFSNNKNTALHYAFMHNNLSMAKHLIESGASISKKNHSGKTAYDIYRGIMFDNRFNLISIEDIWISACKHYNVDDGAYIIN